MSTTEAERWVEQYAAIAKGNRHRISQIAPVLADMRERGIDIIPVKGIDWLLRFYRGRGRRPMYDVDWLVQPEQLAAVSELLAAHGFHELRAGGTFWTQSFFNESFDFESADGATQIDVIWKCWFQRDVRSFWARSEIRKTELGLLRMLHPEDALLLQIMEAVGRRGWLAPLLAQDIVALLETEGSRIDWVFWTARARSLGLAPVLWVGLRWLCDQGVDRLPESAVSALTPRSAIDYLRAKIIDRLVSRDRAPDVQYLLHLASLPTMRLRTAMIVQAFWPRPPWRSRRLGRPLTLLEHLAFLTRPWRILFRFLRRLPQELHHLL